MKPFTRASLAELAEGIGDGEADAWRRRFGGRFTRAQPGKEGVALDVAVLLACAYPAVVPLIEAFPGDISHLAASGISRRRTAAGLLKEWAERGGAGPKEWADRGGAGPRALAAFARREKLRVALRELLPVASCDVDTTARELSDLADVCIGVALAEALAWADARYGVPTLAGGARCPVVVLGMGKLGGRELNCGSDVDLIVMYGSDEGTCAKDGVETSLHEYFTRATHRLIATLDEPTDDGRVWRVDMRLRPEGTRGPLVNALGAAERYYETWGRTWERAALVRARPVAGDLAFGEELLLALAPFVWRRRVDPRLAAEMIELAARARTERGADAERDLKLCEGGIREAELFVQTLQLVWGGRDARLRDPSMLGALHKLRATGKVTDHEGRSIESAYFLLRRLEHRIQFATGLQTHTLPGGTLLDRIARSLRMAGAARLEESLARARAFVHEAFASLEPSGEGGGAPSRDAGLFVALDSGDEVKVLAWLDARVPGGASPDLARHMLALARRPDAPLGGSARETFSEFAAELVKSIAEAADPEQAALFFVRFFSRLSTPTVYLQKGAEGRDLARRMATLFGSSAFLGEVVVGHPELSDRVLFAQGAPGEADVEGAFAEEDAALGPDEREDPEARVGALRRAKQRLVLEVGLADLSGDLGVSEVSRVLSAVADASLARALRIAEEQAGRPGAPLAVVALGKLGGFELGYGSDLDLMFVYDGDLLDAEVAAKIAQRAFRLLSIPHGEGPGYELDARLRPSGSAGLLVTSLEAFARYHGLLVEHGAPVKAEGQDWERQSLVKARISAGDANVGRAFTLLACKAAYDRGAPPPERVHHLRIRMENELGAERGRPGRARYDMKVGYGGIVDVEFAVQWLQMKHGGDPAVRTTETLAALDALAGGGHLAAEVALPLREGYVFLRRLDQRLRILHGGGPLLIEEGAPGLVPLARRMGLRDDDPQGVAGALLQRYLEVTRSVRAAYLAVLGV